MFGSTVLEVAISVIFVYILLSLLCSTINEQVIVRILSLRANTLQEGITRMLQDPELVAQLYNHPLIRALSQDTLSTRIANFRARRQDQSGAALPQVQTAKVRKPAYIPPTVFAIALRDVLMQQRGTAAAPNPSIPLPSTVEMALQTLNIDVEKDIQGIETWFNTTMEQVSGWYKRRVQLIIFLLGLFIAFGLNIDTISLITTVSHDTTVRATLVSAAQGYTTQHADLNGLENNINQLQPMLGWYSLPGDLQAWLLKVVGLLGTTFAVALGAPFWFDVLNKIVSVRSAVQPTPSSSDAAASATPATPSQLVVVKTDGVSEPPIPPVPQGMDSTGADLSR